MDISVIPAKTQYFTKRLRVAAYVRVSTDELEQEDSLENQTAYFSTYIRRNPSWEYAGIYADQGISGFREARPMFQRMIDDARAGKMDLIVVKSVSRFARNTETMLKFTRELKSIGVGVFFELQNINTLSGEGELMLTVLAAFAQAESQGASDNAKLSYRRKFKTGQSSQKKRAAYGFSFTEYGELVIQEEQAGVVRDIFSMAQDRIWPSKIRDALNNRGIPSPGGSQWDSKAVFRVLQNPVYKGDLLLQKTYLDDQRVRHKNEGQHAQWYVRENHAAIVPPRQWDAVQTILAERSLALLPQKTKKQALHRSSSVRYSLTGKLFCPYCGQVLTHKWANSGQDEYWACKTNVKIGSGVCRGIWLPARITKDWGELSEPTTVVQYQDEYGMKRFTAYPKEEYEMFEECPYMRKEG